MYRSFGKYTEFRNVKICETGKENGHFCPQPRRINGADISALSPEGLMELCLRRMKLCKEERRRERERGISDFRGVSALTDEIYFDANAKD